MTTDSISNSDDYSESANNSNQVTTDEARNRLQGAIFSAIESGENTLIEAPTALGKSYQIATTRWREFPEVTGDNLVVHIHQTRDARDEAISKSESTEGVEYHVFEGRQDACPVAAGDYDDSVTAPQGLALSEWLNQMCDARKHSFSKAHSKLDAEYDLPCTANGPCPSNKQWWRTLRDENGSPVVDVVHTTANFAHVEDLIEEGNVVFDERPSYALTLNGTQRQQFQDSLSNLLNHRSDGELSLFDLQRASIRDYPELTDELCPMFDEEIRPGRYFGYEETHRHAPAIGKAMLDSEEVLSGRWMGEHQGVKVVLDNHGKLRHVHYTPDLSETRCVIGLDAFPSVYRWKLNTVDDLSSKRLLSAEERRHWRREERGLRVIQIGEATRSYSVGWDGAGKERAAGLIHHLRQKHENGFQTCITTGSIETDVRQMMEGVGIEPPRTMHYGGQNSRNDFDGEDVGLLIGCIDPGDEAILDLLALGKCSATPEMMMTEDGDETRKPGRTFVGQDADIAREILEAVRESNLAQAVGRYARNPDSSSSTATVYVWSDACPGSLIDNIVEPSFYSTTKKRRNLAEELKAESLQTARQLQATTGMDKSYIIDILKTFESHGLVQERKGTGHQGATEWIWRGGTFETFVEFE